MAKKDKKKGKGVPPKGTALNPIDNGETQDIVEREASADSDPAGSEDVSIAGAGDFGLEDIEASEAVLAEKGKQLMERAVIFQLVKGGFQNQRGIGREIVQTEADKSMLALSKKLLDSAELRKIQAIDRQATDFVEMLALPSPFRFGVWLVPNTLVGRIDKKMRELAADRQVAIEAYFTPTATPDAPGPQSAYERDIIAAQVRLKDLFSASDYPAPAIAQGRFCFGWQFLTFTVPESLAGIDVGLYEAEREKAVEQMKSAVVEIQNALRGQLKALVAKLVERLTPGADGKPKMILKSLGDNLNEFLSVFDLRNVTNDDELEALVEQARALTGRVDVTILRSDMDERAALATAFESLDEQLDTMIVDRPVGQRRVRLQDEAA